MQVTKQDTYPYWTVRIHCDFWNSSFRSSKHDIWRGLWEDNILCSPKMSVYPLHPPIWTIYLQSDFITLDIDAFNDLFFISNIWKCHHRFCYCIKLITLIYFCYSCFSILSYQLDIWVKAWTFLPLCTCFT